ncbi:MAG: tRNA (cytidine(34)-2'-O)-methyltransferase [Phycisphaerales bacterium]
MSPAGAAGSVPRPLFDVVLHEPEIPNNTGNIGRTCVAVGCSLHLIHPLGFELSEKACRRAGLDYWPRLRVHEHASWERYIDSAQRPTRRWFFTTKPGRSLFDVRLERGDALVFGKETAGLPDSILAEHPDSRVSLPMIPGERSLNLATAVCAAVYEGVRQLLQRSELGLDAQGRLIPVPE